MTTIETTTPTSETGFYIIGGTLRRDAPCYVERRADQELYDGLLQGRFCYVLTSRQIGKSSLMVRTAARLREAGTHVVVLDLTAIGQNLNAEQWYDGLLSRVGRQLDLEDELEAHWTAHPRLGPLQRWMSALREVVLPQRSGRVVFFVDEIDAVRSLPFSTDEFFAAIRELYNRRTEDTELERLTFCLLGVALPSDLIRDTRTTPFNIGQRIELQDFTDAEAAPLARGLGRDEQTSARLLKRILYWTGGHPYLTQRLCQAVAEDASVHDAGGVDRLCEELFFTTRARERDDNLLFVRERMLKSETDVAALLDLYKKIRNQRRVKDDETNPLVSVLRLSGVTRVAEGLLYVRNRIYYRVFDREWVLANLPDAEVQRQRAAYRRGLFRAAAVAAVILAIVGGLAFTAFRQRNRAVQSEQANRRLLYTAQIKLAAQSWENGGIGEMRELLDAQIPLKGQDDLRGFEWSYLWRLGDRNMQRMKNEGRLYSFSLSPNEKLLAAADESNNVTIWETTTWQKIKTLSGHRDQIFTPVFSPDSQRLVSRDMNGNLKIWDLVTGREIKANEKLSVNAWGQAFSPDGTKLAVGYRDGTIKFWDTNTWQELLSIAAYRALAFKWPYSLEFSPNGKFLATNAMDGIDGMNGFVKIWDAVTGKEFRSFRVLGSARVVRFSPDSRSLAYCSQSITIWDVLTGKELLTIKNEAADYFRVAFSPDGQMIAAHGSDKIVKVWETKTGHELFAFKGAADGDHVTFIHGGETLIAFDRNTTVLVWNIITKSEPEIFSTGEQAAGWSVFSPDGKTVATAGDDGKARIWDILTGKELFALSAFDKDEQGLMGFFSNGKRLVTVSGNGQSVKVWDTVSQQVVHEFQPIVTGQSWPSGISRDGMQVVTASQSFSEKTLKVWNVNTGQEMFSLKDNTGGISPYRSNFSPDGSLIAIAMLSKTILCDAQTGKELRAFKGTGVTLDLAFSPDGKKLAVGTMNGDVILYDVKTGRKLSATKGHANMVTSVAFSPDGKRLASASYDQKAKLWNVDDGQELLTLSGHTDYVWSVAFSPDGKTLLSTSKDKTIRLWRAATEAEVQARRGQ